MRYRQNTKGDILYSPLVTSLNAVSVDKNSMEKRLSRFDNCFAFDQAQFITTSIMNISRFR